jgi:hypothetical protein
MWLCNQRFLFELTISLLSLFFCQFAGLSDAVSVYTHSMLLSCLGRFGVRRCVDTCSTFAFVSNISGYLLSTIYYLYLPIITASPSLSVSASLMPSSVLSFLSPWVCVLVFTMEWGLPFHSVWYEAITGLLVPEPVSYTH